MREQIQLSQVSPCISGVCMTVSLELSISRKLNTLSPYLRGVTRGISAYLEFLWAFMSESTVIGQKRAYCYITAWPFRVRLFFLWALLVQNSKQNKSVFCCYWNPWLTMTWGMPVCAGTLGIFWTGLVKAVYSRRLELGYSHDLKFYSNPNYDSPNNLILFISKAFLLCPPNPHPVSDMQT